MGATQMTIVLDEASLSRINYPVVAQQFVNHGGVIYKLFVVGAHSSVIARRSIRNMFASAAGGEPMHMFFLIFGG